MKTLFVFQFVLTLNLEILLPINAKTVKIINVKLVILLKAQFAYHVEVYSSLIYLKNSVYLNVERDITQIETSVRNAVIMILTAHNVIILLA